MSRRMMMSLGAVVTPIVLAACYGAPGFDGDRDGWEDSWDCDDGDPAINPDATEICDDEIDNDCDGLIDAEDDDCDTDSDTDTDTE